MTKQLGGRVDIPEAWEVAKTHRRVARFWLLMGLLSSLLLSVPWAALLALIGLARWAILFFASFWVTTILTGAAVRTRPASRERDNRSRLRRHGDEMVTFIGYRWFSPWSLFGVLTAFGAAFLVPSALIGLILLAFTNADLAWTLYWNREVIGLVCYPLILISPYILGYLARGRHRPGLGLTASGIHHWSWFRHRHYAWNDLQDAEIRVEPTGITITIITTTNPPAPSDTEPAKPQQISNRAGGLTTDPRTVQQILTHYLNHPEHRDELGTRASLDRWTDRSAQVR